ncbi:exonuclease SbcCD subunit D [Anaerolineales bacterium HSG6]|nr:exonuclease SbcCD subunit D [Anaerolineales bacterium HSG6]MDM8532596.1 exonuclease SbcCD subunit D [Anaerolineales bacterium HSG25]
MSTPINIFHIADIHIGMENYGRIDAASGLNSRVLDFLRRFRQAIDIAIEQEADICIFAGDAYKNQRPTPTFQREFARRIKYLSDHDIPCVLLVGNHDMATADRAASSLDIFGVFGLKGIIVADREKVHQITCRRGQQLQVATLPYPQRGRLLAHSDIKNKLIEEVDTKLGQILGENIADLANQVSENPDVPAVLAAHVSVSEAKQGSEQSVMIGRDVVIMRSLIADSTWDYVALGHIHKHQELNNGQHPPIVYPGSIERIDFGEEKERKGFVMATVERGKADWKFIPVSARPFVTIRIDVTKEDDPMQVILNELKEHPLSQAIVRLIIKATEEQETLLDDKPIRKALNGASYIASIVRDIDRLQRHRFGNISTEELSPAEALKLYFDTKGMPVNQQDELLSYATAIFEEGDGT